VLEKNNKSISFLQTLDPAVVRITILDVNDNPPVFGQPEYAASVSEDVPVDWSVAAVTATDRDQPGTVNAQVMYTFEHGNDGNGSFYIEHSTGESDS